MFGFGKENYISPGSIGGKIKRIREHLNLSQKQLGLRCGFPESSADVRIRQYESNQKVPREKALKTLCAALDIEESALFDADLLTQSRTYHALFDIEDFYGLHPVEVNGQYYLEFSGPIITKNHTVQKYEQNEFLKKWMEMREKCMPLPEDTDEIRRKKRIAYDLWRYQYPMNEAKETSERIRMLRQKERLEEELRSLNEQLGTSET